MNGIRPSNEEIVLISSEFPPIVGGVGTLAAELARNFAKKGHATTVIAPRCGVTGEDRNRWRQDGVEMVDVPGYRPRVSKPFWYLVMPIAMVLFMLQTWRTVRRLESAHLLALYWFPDGYVARIVARRLNINYTVITHGLEVVHPSLNPKKRRRLTKVLSGADTVVSVSHFTAGLIESFGIPRSQVSVVPPGVDSARYHPSSEGDDVRSRQKLGGRPVLYTLGRLVDYKGFGLVIQALPRILEEFPETLYVIGGDGPHKDELVRQCRENGVEDHVLFLGRLPADQLNAHYNACDVFVMPSHVGNVP